MELRHLRYFVAVAEELSFTRAAQRLFTSQPSLSEQIHNLEKELGFVLLKRNRRKVELSEAGEVFLHEARGILRQVDSALARTRKIAERARGTLRIGFVPAAEVKLFPTVLTELRLLFPDLNVALRSLTPSEQEQALLHEEIDIGFMRPPVHAKSLRSENVLREPLRVFLPAGSELAALEKIVPKQLAGLDFVSADGAASGALHEMCKRYLRRHRIQPAKVLSSSNILMSMNLVAGGFGYALLPAYAEAFCTRKVVSKPLSGIAPRIDLLMVTNADAASASEPLRKLVQLVRKASGR